MNLFFEYFCWHNSNLYGPEIYSREIPVGVDSEGCIIFDYLVCEPPEPDDPRDLLLEQKRYVREF